MDSYETLKIDQNQGYLIVKINRPDVYNALNRQGKLELTALINSVAYDDSIHSIVLTGEGKAFCTGQDLNDRKKGSDNSRPNLGTTLETEWNPLIKAIRQCPKIMISYINGVIAGAGISVGLACDLVISAPGVRFVSGFSKIGLTPDAGITHTFTRALGKSQAMEFFLFNQPLLSDFLQEKGLVNFVSEDGLELAMQWAEEISKMAPLSVRGIKRNVQKAQDLDFDSMIFIETQSQTISGSSEDFEEGIKAFLGKRPPEFKGA